MTARRQIKDVNTPREPMCGHLIGDLARRYGVTTRALRFYEERGLLSSHRAAGGRARLFGEEQVARLRSILKAKDLGFSLEQIRGFLAERDAGKTEPADFFMPGDEVLRSQLSHLEQQRHALDAAIRSLREVLRDKAGAVAPEPRPAPLQRRA
ncbi:DNA-binding transcriptional MerR regulator [Rhodoblastus acidophilus]|uniref:MerR family transcriptional regulator n=1 Tax=Rhodoblastus acidophilus TaxID=1074 RepID=UPI0022256B3B|nr:MerR family transcriptional regulator [Rhodoblastus acidophilus]MCW2282705.1 DNA-binding transcriptional MerR regulator [Rhodoblastus acidophilus]MCW2331566.1 DNA-binding transcriptional MerR regulator [Rhodoblastus acidophilus]